METSESPDSPGSKSKSDERATLREKIAHAFRSQQIEPLLCQRIVETLAQAYEASEADDNE